MSQFSVLLDNTLELLVVEADQGRRRFLKTISGVAASTATGDPSHALKAVAGMAFEDPFANIPDDVLRATPEYEWVTKVPYSRFNRIIKGDREYASHEISNKLMYLVQYGFSNKRHDKKTIKILLKGLKDNGIQFNPSSIYEFVLPYLPYPSSGGLEQAIKGSMDTGRKFLQLTDELGIPIDKRKAMAEIHKHATEYHYEFENHKQSHDLPKKSVSKPEEYEHYNTPPDYEHAASMHQAFESRLRKALRI